MGSSPDRVKQKKGNCCFSAKYAAIRRKTGWLGLKIMCPSGATGLSADSCFSELAQYKSTKRVVLVQSRPHHHLFENTIILVMIKLKNC